MPGPAPARIVGSAIVGGGDVVGTTGVALTKAALETAMGRSLQNGDYLVACISRADDTCTAFACSDGGTWSAAGYTDTSTGNDLATGSLYRKVTNAAGEPSSYTFTATGASDSDPQNVVLFAVSGADPDTFLDVAVTTNVGTNDFTPDHVEIDTSSEDCLIIMVHGASMNAGTSGKSAGAPSYADGLVGSREETGGSVLESFIEVAYKNDAAAGTQTIGVWTGTADDATSEWHVHTLAIRPNNQLGTGSVRGAARGALCLGMVLAFAAGPVRGDPGRVLGSAATDVALAGTIRSGVGSLPGGELSFDEPGEDVNLAGHLRGLPGRLLGAGTTDVEPVGTLRGLPGRLVGSAATELAVGGGTVRSGPGRLTGTSATETALAGVLRAGPGRLLGAATSDVALPGGAVHSGSGRLPGGALSFEGGADVNLAGTLRGAPGRLLTTEFVTAYSAGPVRSGPGRFLGAGLTSALALAPSPIRGTAGAITGLDIVLEFQAGEVRSLPGRLLGTPASDVNLAGTVRSLPGRLTGQATTDVALVGVLHAGPGRLTGALTAEEIVAALAGTLRDLPGRLTGELSFELVGDVNLEGTIASLPGRLLGAATTDVALAGALRSGAGRLLGAVATDVALAGALSGAGRLLGAATTDLAVPGGWVRSGAGRHRGFLLLLFPSDVQLAGVVRAAPGRVMFRPVVLGYELATVRALMPRLAVDGTLEPRYLVVGIGGPRLTVE